MHNPQKRIPPPPSAPPPGNITRSGRIHRPKGAPPGGAKLTNPSRNYEWDAEQRNRNGDAESEDTLRCEDKDIDEDILELFFLVCIGCTPQILCTNVLTESVKTCAYKYNTKALPIWSIYSKRVPQA